MKLFLDSRFIACSALVVGLLVTGCAVAGDIYFLYHADDREKYSEIIGNSNVNSAQFISVSNSNSVRRFLDSSKVSSGANVVFADEILKDEIESLVIDYPNFDFQSVYEGFQGKIGLVETFQDPQTSPFLLGALAAMISKTGNIGFVHSYNGDSLNEREWACGFGKGATYINPNVDLIFGDRILGIEGIVHSIENGYGEKLDVLYNASTIEDYRIDRVNNIASQNKVFQISISDSWGENDYPSDITLERKMNKIVESSFYQLENKTNNYRLQDEPIALWDVNSNSDFENGELFALVNKINSISHLINDQNHIVNRNPDPGPCGTDPSQSPGTGGGCCSDRDKSCCFLPVLGTN